MKRTTGGLLALAVALLLGACARSSSVAARPPNDVDAVTPSACEKVAPGCHAKRLPDVVLRDGAKDGALGPVAGSPDDIISPDEALAAAWTGDGHFDATTVQVELGSADAEALHWDGLCDSACDLFYAIDWTGVCMPIPGPKGGTYPTCQEGDWVTVIDAHTGTFIVGGIG